MKITKQQLKQIIKEELETVLSEEAEEELEEKKDEKFLQDVESTGEWTDYTIAQLQKKKEPQTKLQQFVSLILLLTPNRAITKRKINIKGT